MLIWITRLIFWGLIIYLLLLLWKKTVGEERSLVRRLWLILITILVVVAFIAPDSPAGAAVFSILSFIFKPLGLSIILLIWALSLISKDIKAPAPSLIFSSLLILILFSTPVIAFWIAQQMEGRALKDLDFDGCCYDRAGAIVLLGQGTTKAKASGKISIQLTEKSDRIPYALELYRQGLADKIIVSAGPRLDIEGHRVEAEEIKKLLVYMRAYSEDIIVEPLAKNLRQSALEVKKILEDRNIDPAIILVTSALQMPRASLTFANVGIKVVAAPTDFNTFEANGKYQPRVVGSDFFPNAEALLLSTRVVEEYWALFYYFVRGWLASSI